MWKPQKKVVPGGILTKLELVIPKGELQPFTSINFDKSLNKKTFSVYLFSVTQRHLFYTVMDFKIKLFKLIITSNVMFPGSNSAANASSPVSFSAQLPVVQQ